MADVQEDVNDELLWDPHALVAGDLIDRRTGGPGRDVEPLAGFCPSLHINLGQCYKLGDLDCARGHFWRGQAAVGTLVDDGTALSDLGVRDA